MTIIKLEPVNGLHPIQSQSHRKTVWLDGYIEVPVRLEAAAWASCGYCGLVLKEGELVDLIPTEKPEPPAQEPTTEERLRADLDYLAAVQGVSL